MSVIDLYAGDVSFDIRLSGGTPFLGFEGEAALMVSHYKLTCVAEMPRLGFAVYALSVSDSRIVLSADAPDLNLYPAKLTSTDSFIVLTSETPSLTPGPLPKGLTLVDNGDGTAQIYGTPAPGTAGAYCLRLVAVNIEGEAERLFWLRIKDG